ncbi:MAG: FkbM family methyltransferase [Azonexus sp.]
MAEVKKVMYGNTSCFFEITNQSDVIQQYHVKGEFYEANQLSHHFGLIFNGSTVLDIGSNIGNHAIWYSKCSKARKVYVFEPNPVARSRLINNVSVNQDIKGKVDFSYVNFAVGKSKSELFVGDEPLNNLGATKMMRHSGEEGRVVVPCLSIDDLELQGKVSFVKIDVEGFEIDVLEGGDRFFSKIRPFLSIEVAWWNEIGFWHWVGDYNYHVINVFQDTDGVKNYLLVPKAVPSMRVGAK